VKLFALYHTKVPNDANDCSFHLTPLPFTQTGSRPWFFEEKLSLKKLQGLLMKVCCAAKVDGNFSNHSLRATCTTVLFDAGIPEAII
jgi:integrase